MNRWRDRAACKGRGGHLFFTEDGALKRMAYEVVKTDTFAVRGLFRYPGAGPRPQRPSTLRRAEPQIDLSKDVVSGG